MKRSFNQGIIYSFVSIAIIASSIMIGCKKSDSEIISDKNVRNISMERNISKWAKKLGVDSIQKTSVNGELLKFVFFGKEKNMNGIHVNLDGASLEVSQGSGATTLFLSFNKNLSQNINVGNINYELREKDKSVYDKIENKLVSESELTNDATERKTLLVMVLYNEIANPYLEKISADVSGKNVKLDLMSDEGDPNAPGCDKGIITIMATKSAALSLLGTTSANFIKAHPDCALVGGTDSGCLWGDYYCIATQSIHCTGGGCAVPYGIL